ncbi:MAG TPA: GntR family transcriptional regulator [Streptosporangiaceae bacterium]
MTSDPRLYVRLAKRLREQVGDMKPGDMMPSIAVLAEQAGMSRNTAGKAMRLLDGEGLIAGSRGACYVVAGEEPTLYGKLAATMRGQIQDGTYKPGDRMPSKPELRATAGVALGTAMHALRILAAEGLLVMVPGRGYHVRDDFIPPDPPAGR